MNPSGNIDRLTDLEVRSGRSWEAAIRRDNFNRNSWVRSALLIGLGLLWGGITGFSMAFEDRETQVQAAALSAALLIGFLSFGSGSLVAWLNSTGGFWLAAHVTAAVISGFLSEGPLENIIRYAALLPAFSLLLCVARNGMDSVQKLRLGLTLGGVIFVLFHLAALELGALADPTYRITIFLNPNCTAFIAAMTGLSALDLAFRMTSRKWSRVFWFAIVLGCGLLLFATKSRTALLAMASGVFVFGLLRFRTRPARVAIVLLIFLGIAFAAKHQESIVQTMSLDEKDRSIESGTGRFEIWRLLLTDLIPENPWLGIGPGQHNDFVYVATGSNSSHNGLLAALSETGVIGTLPLVILLFWCARAAWHRRHEPERAWVAGLFVAGVVESIGENIFFGTGNPASLMFMTSVAVLATSLPRQAQAGSLSADPCGLEPIRPGKTLCASSR